MLTNKRTWLAGALVLAVAALVALTLPAGSAADKHEMMGPKGNHFKCYPILDWMEWDTKGVTLVDQFGKSEARVMMPRMLCNPVDKNGEGIADKESHLVCYDIQDDPIGPAERVREVTIRNQFHATQLWVGTSNMLCVPSDKQYQPR